MKEMQIEATKGLTIADPELKKDEKIKEKKFVSNRILNSRASDRNLAIGSP